MKTNLLLDMLAGILNELDDRAGDPGMWCDTSEGYTLDTAWASVSRDPDGRWKVVYHCEGSAEDAAEPGSLTHFREGRESAGRAIRNWVEPDSMVLADAAARVADGSWVPELKAEPVETVAGLRLIHGDAS